MSVWVMAVNMREAEKETEQAPTSAITNQFSTVCYLSV
jgi:hypothetical protein